MNTKSLRLGLIGKDVSKSTSKQIHTFILSQFGVDCHYEALSVPPAEFDGVMRRLLGNFDAFNVTIPYKRDVFEYLDEIVEDAFTCGAVNTVLCDARKGYNTDGKGFLLMLETSGISVQGKKVLVLGLGGSGRSSAVAMKNAGAEVYAYRRNEQELAEACLQLGISPAKDIERGGFDIVVNCTGVGMHDTEGKSPVCASAFSGAKWAVDLIYTPEKSAFLQLAETQGIKTLNGAAMLFYQAYYADCLFLQKTPCVAEAKTLYARYLAQTANNKE